LLVDTLGLLHGVSVGSAGEHDTKAAIPIIEAIKTKEGEKKQFPKLKKILADRGFSSDGLRMMVMLKLGALLDARPREKTPGVKGFQVVPLRWIVERTNAWMIFDRRLAKDYEHNPKTSAFFIVLSAFKRALNRLKS
jgi:putative transposase